MLSLRKAWRRWWATVGADVHAGGDLVVVQSLGDEAGDGLLGVGQAVPSGDGPQDAVRGRGVPVRAEGPGDGQGRLGIGGGLRRPAGGQVEAGTQQGPRRLGGDVLQRRIVRGAEDILRLVGLAQVDQGGGEREQRLDLAGIRRDPGAVPRRITQQLEPVADLAAVPADGRAGEQGRRGGPAVVPGRGGQDGVGHLAGQVVAQPSQGLQVRGQRLVPQAVGQPRPGQDQLGLLGGVPGPAAGTQDRGQDAPQPVLGRRRQRPGQQVTGGRHRILVQRGQRDPGGAVLLQLTEQVAGGPLRGT